MTESAEKSIVTDKYLQIEFVMPVIAKITFAIIAAGAISIFFQSTLTYPLSRGTEFALDFFNLDAERNLPTWFSSALLLANALIIFTCRTLEKQRDWQWLALGAIFVFLSIDEAASIHEAAGRFASRISGLGGEDTQFWIIIAIPILIAIGITFLTLLLSLPSRTRNLTILSALIFISGAVGFEAAGWIFEKQSDASRVWYAWLTLIEESLEMIGQLLFTYTLLDFLSTKNFRLSIVYSTTQNEIQ